MRRTLVKRIEYHTIDKSGWAPGPWRDEPDKIQWRDEETGLPCLIVRAGADLGHLCGYVGVLRDHPLYGLDYSHDLVACVDAHGGITFTDTCRSGPEESSVCHVVESGEDDEVWWIAGLRSNYAPNARRCRVGWR